MSNKFLISIIVPTLNSSYHLETLLKSIKLQKFKNVEIIIADNNSKDETAKIAKKYNAKVVFVQGNPPQVAKQRNVGAKMSKGEYLYFMDHDMELSKDFLIHFAKKIQNKTFADIEAWYVPEKIISKSKILSIARNFESMFINGSPVSAARLIKRSAYNSTNGFDEELSNGPADWDFDIQLRLRKNKFGVFDKIIYHHEENLSIWKYIFKKTTYINGEEIYKNKWREDQSIYKNLVVKQYNLRYRIFWIFVENGKWRKLVRHLYQYFIFLFIKLSMVTVYVYWRHKYVK